MWKSRESHLFSWGSGMHRDFETKDQIYGVYIPLNFNKSFKWFVQSGYVWMLDGRQLMKTIFLLVVLMNMAPKGFCTTVKSYNASLTYTWFEVDEVNPISPEKLNCLNVSFGFTQLPQNSLKYIYILFKSVAIHFSKQSSTKFL